MLLLLYYYYYQGNGKGKALKLAANLYKLTHNNHTHPFAIIFYIVIIPGTLIISWPNILHSFRIRTIIDDCIYSSITKRVLPPYCSNAQHTILMQWNILHGMLLHNHHIIQKCRLSYSNPCCVLEYIITKCGGQGRHTI